MRYGATGRVALIAGVLLTWSGPAVSPAVAGSAVAVSTSEATTCVVRSDGTVWR
jgi:hypothetical protein